MLTTVKATTVASTLYRPILHLCLSWGTGLENITQHREKIRRFSASSLVDLMKEYALSRDFLKIFGKADKEVFFLPNPAK